MPELRRTVGVALAALLLASAPAAAQRTVLDSASQVAWAELLAVHDVRSADTVVIDRAIGSPVAPLRATAARVVGMNRVAARYAALRTLLQRDRDTAVARDAAFALGLASDTSSCGALRDALARPTVGAAAAWSLGELGAACGEFAPLLAVARSSAARAALLRVAGKWTPFPDTVIVAAYRSATSPEQRWAALYALARARRPAGATLAMAASRDAAPSLREVAARLMASTLQPAADSLAVVARLDSMLGDRAPHVRIAAVRAIATFRVLAREPLARAWPLERDANVRVTMAQSVGTVAADSSPLWRRWWESDTTHMVRRSLIASAWQAQAIGALRGTAVDLAEDPDFRVRIAMVDGAATAGVDRNARQIARRLTDGDARVRAAAVTALGGLAPAMRDSLDWPVLLDAVRQDADVGVRTAALGTRRRADAAANVPLAMQAYQRALTDTNSDAREAALDLLAGSWRRDSASFDSATVATLRTWSAPTDPLLRQRVRVVTPLRHWNAAATASAPRQELLRIVREIIVPSLAGRPPELWLATGRGMVRIVLDGVRTPMTTDHLSRLARTGYFRNLRFHRVVPAFVAQGGDPRGDGTGGPGFAIRDELNRSPYVRGAVGMALSGPDTGGSQFFLTLAPQPHLDGHYTVFGRITSGAAAMDALVQGDALRNITTGSP
ncbi:MAG: peptidylprolyl isomerase [Gemmatimonadota bacterium]